MTTPRVPERGPAALRMSSLVRRVARRSLSAVRDAWLIAGLSLMLLVGAELLFRVQSLVRLHISAGFSGPADPSRDFSWFPAYESELRASREVHWEPYLYVRRSPYHGQYINVDSGGLRHTVQGSPLGGRAQLVFFFGGSTMWGTYQRDSFTIPSVVAAWLARRGVRGVELLNYGETGRVFTQEVVALALELRSGKRPDVVVFYDGINDAYSTVQNGRAGIPQNEVNRSADFDVGRQLAPQASDFTAFGELATLAAGRSHLLLRLHGMVRPPVPSRARPAELAADLALTYAQTARLVEALASAYGFRVLYFWQPALQTTAKRLTPYERGLRAGLDADGLQRRLTEVHNVVREELPAAFAAIAPGRFTDLSAVLDRDATTTFLDAIGHTTEAASIEIADSMAPVIMLALNGGPHRAAGGRPRADK